MTTTTSSDTPKDVKLTALTDDGTNNNYAEFALKAKAKLVHLEAWKYIEGPESTPPVIPKLVKPSRIDGVDDNGNPSHITVKGNEEDVDKAKAESIPWYKGNNRAFSLIVDALPTSALHLAKGNQTLAKSVWNNLRELYQPRNTMRATAKMTDILGYRCDDGMNVGKWLTDMQTMYNELVEMDIDKLSDLNFARIIVDLMPQNVEWRGYVSNLRGEMAKAERTVVVQKENGGNAIITVGMSSMTVIARIRDEYWAQHKNDPEFTANVFSARTEANRGKKRPNPAQGSSSSSKRQTCTNKHCERPWTHTTDQCLGYGGAKCGQYWDGWTGPTDIHLLPHQRKSKPKKLNASGSKSSKPSTHQTHADGSSDTGATSKYSRSDVGEHSSMDDDATISMAVMNEVPHFTFQVSDDEDEVVCSAKALDTTREKSNECFHDSGSNRHVFHSRTSFATYQEIPRLKVKGFGSSLSTVAVGRGSVELEATYNGKLCRITLQNCLHVPDARCNLISQVRLNSVGVSAFMENGCIVLSQNGRPIIDGKIVNDMYFLNLTPTSQKVPLVQRIDIPLVDRISPMSAALQHLNARDRQDFYIA